MSNFSFGKSGHAFIIQYKIQTVRHLIMYKGTDIKKHNLEQLRKAQEYFKNNPTKIITIFNDGPKSLAEEIP